LLSSIQALVIQSKRDSREDEKDQTQSQQYNESKILQRFSISFPKKSLQNYFLLLYQTLVCSISVVAVLLHKVIRNVDVILARFVTISLMHTRMAPTNMFV
jgi:hypothetical protein